MYRITLSPISPQGCDAASTQITVIPSGVAIMQRAFAQGDQAVDKAVAQIELLGETLAPAAARSPRG